MELRIGKKPEEITVDLIRALDLEARYEQMKAQNTRHPGTKKAHEELAQIAKRASSRTTAALAEHITDMRDAGYKFVTEDVTAALKRNT